MVVGLPPIGCAPKQRYSSATDACNEEVNNWSKKYNEELRQMLATLQSELKGFHYSYFDTYSMFLDFIQNPKTYGTISISIFFCLHLIVVVYYSMLMIVSNVNRFQRDKKRLLRIGET